MSVFLSVFLKDISSRYRILGWLFSPFIIFRTEIFCLPACIVSDEKSLNILIFLPCVILPIPSPRTVFNILCLSWFLNSVVMDFVQLIWKTGGYYFFKHLLLRMNCFLLSPRLLYSNYMDLDCLIFIVFLGVKSLFIFFMFLFFLYIHTDR